MKRLHQIILIVSMLALTWLGMMVVHEAGHAIGAWTSGGTVEYVYLHPLHFSETVVSHNPHPLWVTWAGPVLGVLIPLGAWLIAARFKANWAYLLRFFTGFCLLANGAYMGIGVFAGIADAGNLMEQGASTWQLVLFGALCMPSAFVLWNRLGTHFGLGEAHGQVNPRHAYVVLAIVLMLILTSTFALMPPVDTHGGEFV